MSIERGKEKKVVEKRKKKREENREKRRKETKRRVKKRGRKKKGGEAAQGRECRTVQGRRGKNKVAAHTHIRSSLLHLCLCRCLFFVCGFCFCLRDRKCEERAVKWSGVVCEGGVESGTPKSEGERKTQEEEEDNRRKERKRNCNNTHN
eukprot:TRINITY_DN9527_c0_g1_i1.p3 TRINITY_DN9527_c0_g1~~TRINITY_DN9527_c0_g1_i1.p3  ORF type:complete len:149 (+),score=8.74 TRINITY_DN9527_c0_g1_i1:364-810(+)